MKCCQIPHCDLSKLASSGIMNYDQSFTLKRSVFEESVTIDYLGRGDPQRLFEKEQTNYAGQPHGSRLVETILDEVQ